jgi:hypothetical protein
MFSALLVICVFGISASPVIPSLGNLKGDKSYRLICASRSSILAALERFFGLGVLTSATGAISSCQGVSGTIASLSCIRCRSTLLNQSDISDRVEKSLSSSSCMTRAKSSILVQIHAHIEGAIITC